MTDTHALAMLALRRVQSRISILSEAGPQTRGEQENDSLDPTILTGGDPVALGRVLRRAVERTWLTLELLFCKEAVGARLGRGGEQTLESIFSNRCFDQLAATPGPFRQTIWRELHSARKAGPLANGDVGVEDLLRQVSGLTHPSDLRALQDLEWYALWQMAGELTRDGYRELRSLFEARSADGDSLLVGLATTFVPFELALEGNPPRPDPSLSILPDDHVRWLCEHSEPLDVLLNEVYSGGRSGAPAEFATRIRQGQTFAQQGEYERAVIEFTAAIQSDITAANAYVHRGDALRMRGEYDRAIADYTQALRLEANNLLAHLNRGLVYRLTGRADAAIGDLTEALRIDPRNVVAFNARGSAHADIGRYDLAIADHTQALRHDPALAWAYQSRGDAYAGQREYDRAIADYTQALRLNPHFPLAHANRGNAYRLGGDLDRAAADYTEALRLDPLNPRMFTSRGDTYRRQHRFDLALADYGEAIRLDPTNPAGYVNRGIAYQQAGNYDLAVADFDRAEQFDSANPEVFYQRALAYQHQQSYERALADLDRAIELNPRDAVARVSRGSLYALQRRFGAAIVDFTEAVRLDPMSAQGFLERGRAHALIGEFDGALADSAEALRLDPHFVPALLIRGGVRIRTGDYAAAVEEFNEAIRINPRYGRAYNDRGVAFSKLGQLDEAVRDFTRAIELLPDYAQAFSNRGNAFQLRNRPDLALNDFAQAVVIDAKYAAAYCVQRGQFEAGRGNLGHALADYTVALAIDPKNRVARTAQTELRAKLATDFALGPATESPPAPIQETVAPPEVAADATMERPPALPTEVVDLTEAIVPDEPAQTQEQSAAPETQLAIATIDAPASEHAEYEAEQRQTREAEQHARLRALAEKAAEIRQRNEAEEAKRRAQTEKKKGKKAKRDPEEEAERWRKRRQYAVICIGAMFAGFWLFKGVWAIIPPAKNPFHTYSAEQLAGEYAKDAAAADGKFADQMVCVRGKLTVVTDKKMRVRMTPPRVYFDIPGGKDDLKIECVFSDPDMAEGINTDSEYFIVGKVQPFKSGKTITLKNATFLAQGGGKAAMMFPPADVRYIAANNRGLRSTLNARATDAHHSHRNCNYERHGDSSSIIRRKFTNPTNFTCRSIASDTLCPS